VAGLDLSSTTDLTGMVFLVEPVEAGEPWLMVPFAYLPDVELQRKADTDRVPYLQWRAEGYLDTTPGRAISKRVILQKLSAMCDFFEIIAVGYDRWRIEDTKTSHPRWRRLSACCSTVKLHTPGTRCWTGV